MDLVPKKIPFSSDMIIEDRGPPNKVNSTPESVFRAFAVKTRQKKRISFNPQYFQTKINAKEMPPEVSRFREPNLLPKGARQIQNLKEKV